MSPRSRPTRAQPRRDMTADERSLALALSPARVRYSPASSEKRFAWSMADQAEHGTPPQITERQAQYLITLAIRMRRQIAADVLATAERLAKRPIYARPDERRVAQLRCAAYAGGALARRADGGAHG